MTRRALLVCGIASVLVYLSYDIAAALRYTGYDPFSQTVSEIVAIGAPSAPLAGSLGLVYGVLMVAFGLGVWLSAGGMRGLRFVGTMLAAATVFGYFWPPMHMRGSAFTQTDSLHIVWTVGWLSVTMAAMVVAGVTLGRRFLVYTIASIVVELLFGALTGMQAPRIAANLPTPWVGVSERICIGAFLLWIVVLAVELWRRNAPRPRDAG